MKIKNTNTKASGESIDKKTFIARDILKDKNFNEKMSKLQNSIL